MLAPDELLDAIAGTLRQQVGPAVAEPFAKTQAFMAAVILEKLAGDLRVAAEPHDDGRAERRRCAASTLGDDAPERLITAVDDLDRDGATAAWRALVEAALRDRVPSSATTASTAALAQTQDRPAHPSRPEPGRATGER